ncbi:GNAT family N-acetyltransferase [Paenibacillus shunpengii]|uniref:GNAT family N-acetyltransferase n=1 Tax=Paenibacillus shunpengii TaxID=2054424 RepID=A0ABW5SUA2_9BACL
MIIIQEAIEVRLSHLRDARQLMDLDALVWDEHTAPGPVQWTSREQYLNACPPGSQMIAVMDTRVVGYVGFRTPTGLRSNSHVLEIHIAVHPAYQKQGIGSMLMDAVKELAREQQVRKLRLRVLSHNRRALAFYQKCGFIEEGRLLNEFCIGGKYVDDILMRYLLK